MMGNRKEITATLSAALEKRLIHTMIRGFIGQKR